MKTNGQLLYEHKHPALIRVRHASDHFGTGDVLLVANPAEPAPWRLLTERCRASWEEFARGHNMFSAMPQ